MRRRALLGCILGVGVLGLGDAAGRGRPGGVGAAVAHAGPADAETERCLARVAAGAPSPEFDACVRTVRTQGPEARARLAATLRTLLGARHAAWVAAAGKVAATTARVGDGAGARALRETWEAARDAATAWVFDERRFPTPAEPLVTGPKEGYGEAKARGDAAVRAWDRLEPALARALAPALGLDDAKAAALTAARDAARAAYGQVAAHLDEAALAPFPPPAVDPLAEALLAAAAGDGAAVTRAFAVEPDPWRRLCLFHGWCAAVVRRNEATPCDMEPDALRALAAMNGYRRALGISPVAHDVRLARAARGHAEEMTRLGFFSHRSPTAGRERKEQRAALEGYAAPVVECITAVGGGAGAIEFWKYDGGHHRDLVDPAIVEAGASTRGPAVYVGGRGDRASPPVLRLGR